MSFGSGTIACTQRNRLERRPSGCARHAARGAVAADHRVGVNFLARAILRALRFDDQAAAIRMQRLKAAPELDLRAGLLRLRGKALDQRAAFDDQVGMIQRDRGGAAIGEKLEAANFVDDAVFGGAAQKRAHAVRHDQRPRLGFERFDALEDAHGKSAPRQQKRCEKARGRSADHRDAWVSCARSGTRVVVCRAL